MSNDAPVTEAWWQGVEQWYHGDYLSAMELWQAVLDDRHAVQNHDSLSALQDVLVDIRWASRNKDNNSLADLWLFLAGCWLDAGDYTKAQQALLAALRDCPPSKKALLARVLSEYIASEQEQGRNIGYTVLRLALEQVDGLPWTSPYQRPGYLHPQLPSQPFYTDADRPSWCNDLEAHWQTIYKEYRALESNYYHVVGSGVHRDGAGQHDGSVVDGEWTEVVLFGSGQQQQAVCPTMRQMIRQYCPSAVDLAAGGGGEVILSRLAPHTHIHTHCAPDNLRLTAHFALDVPKEKCRIRIADQWHTWTPGKILVFDDSYEHEVINDSDQPRVVLLLRFWNPRLAIEERHAALSASMEHKRLDRQRRFHPPLPLGSRAIEDRQLGREACRSCGQAEISVTNRAVFCAGCGQMVE